MNEKKLEINDFTVEVRRNKNKEKGIAALVTLDYLGMRIKGFRVMETTDRYTGAISRWVNPPQYYNRARNKFSSLFHVEEKLWHMLSEKVLNAYLEN